MAFVLSSNRSEDPCYRHRSMEILTQQLVKDHQDLCRSWTQLNHEQMASEDLDVVIRTMGWMKEELFALKEMNNLDIECQIFGMIRQIESDLLEKSWALQSILGRDNSAQLFEGLQ